MDVLLDDNIVQFLTKRLPSPPNTKTFSLRELQQLSCIPHCLEWQKPSYEEIGCQLLDFYFARSAVGTCSQGCINLTSNNTSNDDLTLRRDPNEVFKSVKNQLLHEMRLLKVRLTKIDEKTRRTLVDKGLIVTNSKCTGLQNAQVIPTDNTYKLNHQEKQLFPNKITSIQPIDSRIDDSPHQACSVLASKQSSPTELLLMNASRVTRSNSRGKQNESKLVSSNAFKTIPPEVFSSIVTNKQLVTASPACSLSIKATTSKTSARFTKTEKQKNSSKVKAHDRHQSSLRSSSLKTKNSETFQKNKSGASQVRPVVSPKRGPSPGDQETSRYGRTIKKVKLTSYDATPSYMLSLQPRLASLRTRKVPIWRNLSQKGSGVHHSETGQSSCDGDDAVTMVSDGSSSDESSSDQSYRSENDFDLPIEYSKMRKIIKSRKKVSKALSISRVDSHKQKKNKTTSKNKNDKRYSSKKVQPLNSSSTHIIEMQNKMGPPEATLGKTSKAANLRSRRAPLKPKNNGESALKSSNFIVGVNKSLEPQGKQDAVSNTKTKSTDTEKTQIRNIKKRKSQTEISDHENVPPNSEINIQIKNKKKQHKGNGLKSPSIQKDLQPVKVTAKKGTLTHLKQRQKRQKYLLQQQQKNYAFDDFFDDTDNPQIGNFHKAKYRINELLLNSPVAGDSTTWTNFDGSCGSPFQTPTTSKSGEKSTGNCNKKGKKTTTGRSHFDAAAYTPRSMLLARFAGEEIEGRGWMVNTPTTTSKGGDMGINLGLAVTPGDLLEQSVTNRIIYNNKMKRPRKRPVLTGQTPLKQTSVVDSSYSRANNHSVGRNLSKSLEDGSLGQSPDTSLQKRTSCLPDVHLESGYSPTARRHKLKRLKLPRILDDQTSLKDGVSDHDDYFADAEN